MDSHINFFHFLLKKNHLFFFVHEHSMADKRQTAMRDMWRHISFYFLLGIEGYVNPFPHTIPIITYREWTLNWLKKPVSCCQRVQLERRNPRSWRLSMSILPVWQHAELLWHKWASSLCRHWCSSGHLVLSCKHLLLARALSLSHCRLGCSQLLVDSVTIPSVHHAGLE